MCFRRSWLLLGILLIPIAVRADDHRADFYVGFSGGNGASTLLGAHQEFAKVFPQEGAKFLSIFGDFSVQFGSHDDKDVTQVTYMGGARATIGKSDGRHKFFFHGLGGRVYTNDGVDSGNDWALGGGFGYECLLAHAQPFDGWGIPRADRLHQPLWHP